LKKKQKEQSNISAWERHDKNSSTGIKHSYHFLKFFKVRKKIINDALKFPFLDGVFF